MAQLGNVWRQQRLSLSTKLRIYTSLVQSVVLYGSDTWTMRKVDSDRIPGLPWVWGFPWVWVWDGYGVYDESPWVCGDSMEIFE